MLAASAAVSVEAVLNDSDLLGRFFDAFGTAHIVQGSNIGEFAFIQPRPPSYHLRTEYGRQAVSVIVYFIWEACARRRIQGFRRP